MAAMRKAANFSNMIDRLKDVPAVLDNLAQWNADAGHKLRGRLDLERVGMSGHSFGALTTQGVSGMSIPVIGLRYQDSRIRAALPMSPSAPNWVGSASRSFAKVGIPWMLMTGTKDDSPIGNTSPMDRQKVFAALPAGEHYELVLDGAEHGAFTEMAGRTRWSTSQNPNHHRVILALSTAFWDAYLMNRPEARQWLRGTGPKGISQPGDVFRIK
jgi:predicted dienelactone hydrolase